MLPGSSRPLSGTGVGPAQVGFDPSGRWLIVTEKNTNLIDVYGVEPDGYASAPTISPSAGQTPFGFAFNSRNRLVVSEAQAGGAGASTVSSYRFDNHAPETPMVVSAAVPDTQTAACWVAISPNGR